MIKQLTVVIPVYNEAKNIERVLDELLAFFEQSLPELEYQILCINDCSKDSSGEIIAAKSGVDLVHHKVNKGYGAALKTGIRHAKFEHILIMDSDGQHRPEYICEILEKYSQDFDMVVGSRHITNTKKNRVLGKLVLNIIANFIFSYKIPDINSGLRIFKRETALKYLHLCSDRFSFTTSITLAYLSENLDIYFLPIKVADRSGGKSYVTFKTGLRTLLKIIQIGMIFKPLRVLLPLCFTFGLVFLGTFSIDVLDGNIGDSTVLLFVTMVLLFVFALLSDQLSSIRREING